MPYGQLRALVISLIGPDPEPEPQPEPDPDGDPASEFDSLATTCRGPRTSTLDQLIAFLRKR